MIICICCNVTEEDIRDFKEGGYSFDEISDATGCSQSCGTCHQAAKNIFEKHELKALHIK